MQTCLRARRQQINEEKRKCQVCLRGHSLNWGLLGNTMPPEIIILRVKLSSLLGQGHHTSRLTTLWERNILARANEILNNNIKKRLEVATHFSEIIKL